MDIMVMDGKPMVDEVGRFNEGGDPSLLDRIVDHFDACIGDRCEAAFRPHVGEGARDMFRNTVRKCISSRIQGDMVVGHVAMALLCRLKGLRRGKVGRNTATCQQDAGDVTSIPRPRRRRMGL